MSHTLKLHWYAVTSKPGYDAYELWNDSQCLLTLFFNQFSQTAKVECESSRRNFKIEKEGFLRNKTILKNEYGVAIGELGLETWYSHEGFIDLNGDRFFYTTQHNELLIYKTSKKSPLVVCELSITGNNLAFPDKNKDIDKYASLLMALCWYIANPVKNAEPIVAYAK